MFALRRPITRLSVMAYSTKIKPAQRVSNFGRDGKRKKKKKKRIDTIFAYIDILRTQSGPSLLHLLQRQKQSIWDKVL